MKAQKEQVKHTAGPVTCADGRGISNTGCYYLYDENGNDLNETPEEAIANSELIAEAFNVAHETGFTPRQLAEQKAELLLAAKHVLAEIDADRLAHCEDSFREDTLGEAAIRSAIAKATKGEA